MDVRNRVAMLISGCVAVVIAALGLTLGSGCGEKSGGGSNGPAREEIVFSAAGEKGIFDPSLAFDPSTSRIWFVFSEVGDSAMWPGINFTIQTRLAYSDDAGAAWTDTGININQSEDVNLPLTPPLNAGTWNNEVPAIVYDPGAAASERWKVFWHHYLWINGTRAFDNGWIAMKTAPAPEGPWSSERKLFVGSIYNTDDDTIIGPPEVQLDQFNPDLNNCLTFTEPGLLATADALYVALQGIEDGSDPSKGRIILLKWPYSSSQWEYKGTLLFNPTDGPYFGYQGFSAPEMFSMAGRNYLLAVPQLNGSYQGTFLFEIEDLNTAALKRTGGVPDLLLELHGNTNIDTGQHGAAGYVAEATACGILYSEAHYSDLHFRIYASHRNP